MQKLILIAHQRWWRDCSLKGSKQAKSHIFLWNWRARLGHSRNFRSKSDTAEIPSNKSWPKMEKRGLGLWIFCWPNKSCLKSTKINPRPSQTSKGSISDTFPINKCCLGSSQGPLTQFQKIRILVIFRVWKSYFESGPIFSKDFLNVQTRMDWVRTWTECI